MGVPGFAVVADSASGECALQANGDWCCLGIIATASGNGDFHNLVSIFTTTLALYFLGSIFDADCVGLDASTLLSWTKSVKEKLPKQRKYERLSKGQLLPIQSWLHQPIANLQATLKKRQGTFKIASNIGWLFADRILRMGVGLIIGVWTARYLGPEQFGQLNYAIAWVSIFSAIAGLGLDSIAVRDLVREPYNQNVILGSTFWLKLIGGVFTWLLIVAASFLLPSKDMFTNWLVWILSAGMIFQSFDTIELWFQSQVKSNYIVLGRSPTFILINLVKVLLIRHQAPLISFAWVGLVEVILGAVGLLISYKISNNNIFQWKTYCQRARQLLNDSYPLIFSGLLIMIYMRVDQIMISMMKGDRELGLYSAAVRIAEVWYFLPTAIASSTLPSIVEAQQISENLFYQRLQKLYGVMAALGYAIAIPISLLAQWLVYTLYGNAFIDSGKMLAILVWSGIFVNLGIARSSFLTTMNWTKFHLFTVFLGAIANVILNLLLIPSMGGIGASIATLVAYWIATHISCFIRKPLFKSGIMITKSLFLQLS